MLRIVLSVVFAAAFLYYGVFSFVLDDDVKQAGVICREKHPNLTIVDLPIITDQGKLFNTTNQSRTIKCYVLCLLRELYVFLEDDEVNKPMMNATGILMMKYLGDILQIQNVIHGCHLRLFRSNITDECDKAMYFGHCLHNFPLLTVEQILHTKMNRNST